MLVNTFDRLWRPSKINFYKSSFNSFSLRERKYCFLFQEILAKAHSLYHSYPRKVAQIFRHYKSNRRLCLTKGVNKPSPTLPAYFSDIQRFKNNDEMYKLASYFLIGEEPSHVWSSIWLPPPPLNWWLDNILKLWGVITLPCSANGTTGKALFEMPEYLSNFIKYLCCRRPFDANKLSTKITSNNSLMKCHKCHQT